MVEEGEFGVFGGEDEESISGRSVVGFGEVAEGVEMRGVGHEVEGGGFALN